MPLIFLMRKKTSAEEEWTDRIPEETRDSVREDRPEELRDRELCRKWEQREDLQVDPQPR